MEFETDFAIIVECNGAVGDVVIPRIIHSDDHTNLDGGHDFRSGRLTNMHSPVVMV